MSGLQSDQGSNNNAPSADGATTAAATGDDKVAGSPLNIWKTLDPRIIDLIYWRDVQKTAVLLSATLVTLLSFVLFSVLSVVAYASLIVMTVTLSFRIYKNVKAAIYKTGEGHPFQRYLDLDLSLEQSSLYNWTDYSSSQLLKLADNLRRLFLVDDLVDSLKFYTLLYLMTYIGSWFNATTLIIIADIALFSVPKVYEVYEVEINDFLKQAQTQIKAVTDQVKQAIGASGLKKYL